MAANIAFILICSGLVFLMTPALAFFYGGLERRKNILNTMMMVICTMGLASLIWIVIGYSLSFSGDGDFIGNLDKVLSNDVCLDYNSDFNRISCWSDAIFCDFSIYRDLVGRGLLSNGTHGLGRRLP